MLLSGRYVEIHVLPLSFKEFLDFYEFETAVTIEEKFQRYMLFLCSNIGSITSPNHIGNVLSHEGDILHRDCKDIPLHSSIIEFDGHTGLLILL